MTRLAWGSLAAVLLAPAAAHGAQEPLTGKANTVACPDYALYASFPQ